MKLSRIAIQGVLAFALMSEAYATNKLNCTYSSKSGDNGCFFKDMRLYNQRLVSDNHCAPTSAAMGLSAITFGGLSYYIGSWTDNNFVYKSEVQRINAFGSLMSTSSSSGTSWSKIKKYADREADIVDASGNTDEADDHSLNDSHMREMVRRNEVDILDYGHYKEKITNIGSSKVYTYDRDGGHVIAVNGYYYYGSSSSYTTHTFDPWGAVEKHRDLTYLPNYTTLSIFGIKLDYRPYDGKTQYVYRSGDKVKIIDFITGINSN